MINNPFRFIKIFFVNAIGFCRWSAVLVLAALVSEIPAQISFDFSGYIMDFPVYQKNSQFLTAFPEMDEDQFTNLTRLRLRPLLQVRENGRLVLEYEINGLYFSSPALLLDTPQQSPRQIWDDSWRPVNESRFQLTHFVDRLYFRQNFRFGTLVIGRQRISWGTGRIWNPTDFFNPINPANFSKIEKDGADALSFKYFLGFFTDLELVYNPEDDWNRHNFAARFRTNFRQFDMALVSGYMDERPLLGGDFAGNISTAGIRGEFLYAARQNNGSDAFLKFILGTDYQFTAKLYGLAEYYYNGEGASHPSAYNILAVFEGSLLNVARNYLFLQFQYQLHPLVSLTGANNLNLDDGSGFGQGAISVSTGNNSAVNLGALLTYGNPREEYWYYPTAVYLSGEWYF